MTSSKYYLYFRPGNNKDYLAARLLNVYDSLLSVQEDLAKFVGVESIEKYQIPYSPPYESIKEDDYAFAYYFPGFDCKVVCNCMCTPICTGHKHPQYQNNFIIMNNYLIDHNTSLKAIQSLFSEIIDGIV